MSAATATAAAAAIRPSHSVGRRRARARRAAPRDALGRQHASARHVGGAALDAAEQAEARARLRRACQLQRQLALVLLRQAVVEVQEHELIEALEVHVDLSAASTQLRSDRCGCDAACAAPRARLR